MAINLKNPISCLLSEQCIICFFIEIADLIKHSIYVIEINNPESILIVDSIRYKFISDICSKFVLIIFECIIEAYAISCGLSYFMIRHSTFDIAQFSANLDRYRKWKQLSDKLNDELPNATYEDLENEDCCIICRLRMGANDINNNVKKLPCGHCYHSSCLQQWIIQQMKCPLCQYDLQKLINPKLNEMQKTENLDELIDELIKIDDAHEDVYNELEIHDGLNQFKEDYNQTNQQNSNNTTELNKDLVDDHNFSKIQNITEKNINKRIENDAPCAKFQNRHLKHTKSEEKIDLNELIDNRPLRMYSNSSFFAM